MNAPITGSAGTCSDIARALDEPLAGSAPLARWWILIEQPGPWGRDALTQSHLDPRVGQALKDWAETRPVRLGLIRRPGPHADAADASPSRTVLLARCDPDQQWRRTITVREPAELLRLVSDLEPEVATKSTDASRPLPNTGQLIPPGERLLAVCTNAKRDRCCAVRGRHLATELAVRFPGQVWETSHLGGHRFAPTLVSLPDGYLYGGPNAGTLTTAACRGRSSLDPEAQAAELAALTHLGQRHPRPLQVANAGAGRWGVHDPSTKTRLLVAVSESAASIERPESCRKPPGPWQQLSASVLA